MSHGDSTVLLADVHLDPQRPETTRLFTDYLDGPAREASRLYILGDLFEAWIGDDAPGPLGEEIAGHLRRLSDAGTDIHFVCGNRDFLLREDYCRHAGMTYRTEPVAMDHDGHSILLLHGDVLCTDDTSYQRFRRKVRNPAWQRRVLASPVWWRKLLARAARLMSKRHTGSTEVTIMDVNAEAVKESFREHGVRRMLHGHTHRPAIHDIEVDGRHCQRIVVGDWHEHGSIVRIDQQGIIMYTVARDRDGQVELRLTETAAPLVGQGNSE